MWIWIEKRNIDLDISTFFVNALPYIAGEVNGLTQCQNLTIQSGILRIGWLSIILGYVPKSLTRTQQMYFTHIGSKKMGHKWSIQLITQIWKLVYGQWLNCSKPKHTIEALDDNTKELIIKSKIIDEHIHVQDTLPDH